MNNVVANDADRPAAIIVMIVTIAFNVVVSFIFMDNLFVVYILSM